MMKILKIIYILITLLLALFSIALLGASGHSIVYLKNEQNIFFLVFSIILISVAIYSVATLVKSSLNNLNSYIGLLVITIIAEAIAIIKVVDVSPMTDSDSWLFVMLLSFLIALSAYFIVKRK